MAKQKPKPVSRVSPSVDKIPPKFIQYDALRNGDAFLHEGALWMKCENCEQEAINLDTGRTQNDMCDCVVEPVNITIKWTRK